MTENFMKSFYKESFSYEKWLGEEVNFKSLKKMIIRLIIGLKQNNKLICYFNNILINFRVHGLIAGTDCELGYWDLTTGIKIFLYFAEKEHF